jgi:hypothetical protein
MQNITTTEELKNAIQLLEIEQCIKGELLKEQFQHTCDSFKPINILKGTLKDIITSPNLIDNVLGTIVGMTTGYVSRKIFVGSSGNIFRKLFGSVLQTGIANSVSQHPDAIKSLSHMIFERFFHKKERNYE